MNKPKELIKPMADPESVRSPRGGDRNKNALATRKKNATNGTKVYGFVFRRFLETLIHVLSAFGWESACNKVRCLSLLVFLLQAMSFLSCEVWGVFNGEPSRLISTSTLLLLLLVLLVLLLLLLLLVW